MTDEQPVWRASSADASPRLYNLTTRFFAAVMIVGGILGLAMTLLTSWATLARSWFTGAMTVIVAALFVWATAVGIGLWRGTPFGRRWAPVVFASQVPILALPIVHYHWFTGLTIGPVLAFGGGDTILNFLVRFGASARVQWLAGGDRVGVGLNLFALMAAAATFYTARSLARAHDARPRPEEPDD